MSGIRNRLGDGIRGLHRVEQAEFHLPPTFRIRPRGMQLRRGVGHACAEQDRGLRRSGCFMNEAHVLQQIVDRRPNRVDRKAG